VVINRSEKSFVKSHLNGEKNDKSDVKSITRPLGTSRRPIKKNTKLMVGDVSTIRNHEHNENDQTDIKTENMGNQVQLKEKNVLERQGPPQEETEKLVEKEVEVENQEKIEVEFDTQQPLISTPQEQQVNEETPREEQEEQEGQEPQELSQTEDKNNDEPDGYPNITSSDILVKANEKLNVIRENFSKAEKDKLFEAFEKTEKQLGALDQGIKLPPNFIPKKIDDSFMETEREKKKHDESDNLVILGKRLEEMMQELNQKSKTSSIFDKFSNYTGESPYFKASPKEDRSEKQKSDRSRKGSTANIIFFLALLFFLFEDEFMGRFNNDEEQ